MQVLQEDSGQFEYPRRQCAYMSSMRSKREIVYDDGVANALQKAPSAGYQVLQMRREHIDIAYEVARVKSA